MLWQQIILSLTLAHISFDGVFETGVQKVVARFFNGIWIFLRPFHGRLAPFLMVQGIFYFYLNSHKIFLKVWRWGFQGWLVGCWLLERIKTSFNSLHFFSRFQLRFSFNSQDFEETFPPSSSMHPYDHHCFFRRFFNELPFLLSPLQYMVQLGTKTNVNKIQIPKTNTEIYLTKLN